MPSPRAALTRARERRPFLDHLVRTVQRYQADAGDRLAAAVTFYWFLSLFPLLLLGVAALGVVYDDPAKDLSFELAKVLPTTLALTLEDVITSNEGTTGVIGLVGLLLSGLGWIDALREAVRTMWHQNVLAGNIVLRKLTDVVVLVGLFVTLGASVVFTGLVTSFTGTALDWLGADQESAAAQVSTRLVGYALAVVVDTAVFLYVLTRLSRVRSPLRRVLHGAVFGAVGFEVLKVLGGIYVERSTAKGEATYGTFAVVVGLLLFLNLVSRLLLLTAAFVVTAPYDSDVAPSGTASPGQDRRAGMPVHDVDGTPDDPPAILDDGAPTPLASAVRGRVPPQDQPGRSWSRAAEAEDEAAPPATVADEPAAPRGVPARADGSAEKAVRAAASAGVGAVAVLLLAVLAHLVGTVRRLRR